MFTELLHPVLCICGLLQCISWLTFANRQNIFCSLFAAVCIFPTSLIKCSPAPPSPAYTSHSIQDFASFSRSGSSASSLSLNLPCIRIVKWINTFLQSDSRRKSPIFEGQKKKGQRLQPTHIHPACSSEVWRRPVLVGFWWQKM